MLITGWRQPNPSNGSEFLDSPLAEKDSHKRRRSYILAGMSKKILRTVVPDVPRAIFEKFLDELIWMARTLRYGREHIALGAG